jgi:Domain of unknown function (DUF4274)/Ankyrin repeats (3 copies)
MGWQWETTDSEWGVDLDETAGILRWWRVDKGPYGQSSGDHQSIGDFLALGRAPWDCPEGMLAEVRAAAEAWTRRSPAPAPPPPPPAPAPVVRRVKKAPSRKTAATTLHRRAQTHNWDEGTAALRKILDDPGCDRGTALLIYWRATPHSYRRYARPDDAPEHAREVARLVADLERRLLADGFVSNALRFDPTNDKGADRTRPSEGDEFLAVRPIPAALLRANLEGGAPPEGDLSEELLNAAQRGEVERVRGLLARGASPSAKDREAGSALHIAARVGNVEIVEALIAAGAKVENRSRAQTPLDCAASCGHVAVAEALMKAGARPAKAMLQWAVFGGPAMIRLLVERGAALNGLDADGESPLYWAATRARLDSVEELLRLGADRSLRRRKDNATAAEKVRKLIERARYVSPLRGPDEAEIARARTLEAILVLLERS